MKDSYRIQNVYRDDVIPENRMCPSIIASRHGGSYLHKLPGVRTEKVPCDEHNNEYDGFYDHSCTNCKIKSEYITAEMRLEEAFEHAKYVCTLGRGPVWVIDCDTLEIIAAFRASVERLL